MGTSEKIQFKMILPPELVEDLKQAASRFNKHSGQEVVEEVIRLYLPVWKTINESVNRAVTHQINLIADEASHQSEQHEEHHLWRAITEDEQTIINEILEEKKRSKSSHKDELNGKNKAN